MEYFADILGDVGSNLLMTFSNDTMLAGILQNGMAIEYTRMKGMIAV